MNISAEEEFEDAFEIRIDFEPGVGDPARVYKSMSGLIEAIQSLNTHLAGSYNISLDASLVLDEIQSGSIKSWFRDIISGVPDEALENAEWKRIVGHFLLKSKYIILKWLEERDAISDRDDVRTLENDLRQAAEETNLKQLPAYGAPPAEALLSDIRSIQESLESLEEKDSATYRYKGGVVGFNRELNISNEIIREVLTKEVVESSGSRIIKVKKPDYLGQSMWAFQYDGRFIEAKITDSGWLARFQSRADDVRPGDSLRVILYEEISYGYEGEVVHRHYEVREVNGVIHPPDQGRMGF